jgi:hypothetical protein
MTNSPAKRARAKVVVAIRPRVFLKWWIVVLVVLTVLSYGEFFFHYRILRRSFSASELFFYLDTEGNLPVWVSCFGLLLAGVLAAVVARAPRPDGTATIYWILMAAGFSLMSIDEMCQYHEQLTLPIWTWLQARHLEMGGYLRNAWVLPALVLVPCVLAALIPFLRSLGIRERNRFLIAGAVYLGGAIGFEVISGHEFYLSQGLSLESVVLGCTEETVELLGIGLFNYALLAYLDDHMRVQLGE